MTLLTHEAVVGNYYGPSANGPKWYLPRTVENAITDGFYPCEQEFGYGFEPGDIYRWRTLSGNLLLGDPYWAGVDTPSPEDPRAVYYSGAVYGPLALGRHARGIRFRREDGSVRLCGNLGLNLGFAFGGTMFTLPAGFRPPFDVTFDVATTVILATSFHAATFEENFKIAARRGTAKIAPTGVCTYESGRLPSATNVPDGTPVGGGLVELNYDEGDFRLWGFDAVTFPAASEDNLSVAL